MRKIQVIGNITKDAEVKHFEGGRSVINFDLACNQRWKDKNGTKQEKVHYLKCAVWRENTAIVQYLLKGVKLFVEGEPEVEAYINKDGKAVGAQRINVREIEFLGGTKKPETSSSSATTSSSDDLVPTPDDNLPF